MGQRKGGYDCQHIDKSRPDLLDWAQASRTTRLASVDAWNEQADQKKDVVCTDPDVPDALDEVV